MGLNEFCSANARLMPLADSVAQLVITSPPYNVGIDYGEGVSDSLPWAEYYSLIGVAAREIYRILRPGGVLAMVVPHMVNVRGERQRLEPVYLRVWSLVEQAGFLLRKSIIWAKGSYKKAVIISPNMAVGSPANPNFRAVHEVIILANKEHYHRLGTGPKGGRRGQLWGYMDWLKDVWLIPPVRWKLGRRKANYPATFPVEIPTRLILLLSEPGELVVDPFAGSGTTIEVAQLLGRRAVGFDISPLAASLAKVKQLVLLAVPEMSETTRGDQLSLFG